MRHEVEPCTDDGRVIASREGMRHRHAPRVQSRQDAVLAAHIVGDTGLYPTRRTTKHDDPPAVRGLDRDVVREI